MKNIILSIFLLLSLPAFAARFECATQASGFSGWLDLSATLRAEVNKTSALTEITTYDFSYEAIDDHYLWSGAQVVNAGPVTNNPNYRPRVYKDHLQFDISQGVFGSVKLLIPSSALENTQDFTVTLIMSWIEDHAGDSVSLECRYI